MLAPLPALVTVGSRPGCHLLVDLERLGVLALTGDPHRCGDLLRHIAVELAHNPWAELVEVTLAGFPPEQAELLVSLNPARVRVADSLPEAVAALAGRAEQTTAALAGHGLADAWHGRVRDVAADTWTPQLLLVYDGGQDEPALAALSEQLAGARRCAVAVVTRQPTAGGRSVTVAGDGIVSAAFLAGAPDLPAAALPADLLAPLVGLLREAASPQDYPIPPASQPWAAGTDAAGGAATDAGWSADTPALPLPVVTPAGDAAGHQFDGRPPRVELLGPVRLVAAGPVPQRRRRACEELVVLLVARGADGATAAEAAEALWPHQRTPATVRNEVITSARRWLERAPDGDWWLPEADVDGRYRLRDGMLVDWHLFRQLRARARRMGSAADLRAALRLVRGQPLAEAATSGPRPAYTWLPGTDLAPDLLLAGVIDAAHELVERCLVAGDATAEPAAGELATARWAVEQAWQADPARGDDQPWRDLMRIAHAEGGPEQVRQVVDELLRWREADGVDELTAATRAHIAGLLHHRPVPSSGSTS